MAKLKKGLALEVEEEIKEQEDQKRLHEKHGIKDNNIKIVEKSSAYRVVFTIIRVLAEIVLISLAAVGVIALIYKAPRMELLNIFVQMYEQILSMI